MIFLYGGLLALLTLALRSLVGSPAGKMLASNQMGGKPDFMVKRYATGLPSTVQTTLLRGDDATRTELELAASSASVAGYPMLADALRSRASMAGDVSANMSGSPHMPTSPFAEVPHSAWIAFLRTMAKANPESISDRGKAGIFQVPVRRLVDLGVMKSPRKLGKRGIWTADWIMPRTEWVKPHVQYRLFEQSMRDYKGPILDRFRRAIGTSFEGRPATLSGLLAVAHHVGLEGLGRWLSNDPPRSKFKTTAEAYARANGIF